jgi:hypothetical protein
MLINAAGLGKCKVVHKVKIGCPRPYYASAFSMEHLIVSLRRGPRGRRRGKLQLEMTFPRLVQI